MVIRYNKYYYRQNRALLSFEIMRLLKYKLSILTLLLIVMTIACNNENTNTKDSIKLKIELTNGFKGYIYLYRITPNSTVPIDSALVKESVLNFEIQAFQSPDIYLLRLSPRQSLMFTAKNSQNISIKLDPNTIPLDYTIENSFGSKLIKENNSLINSSVRNFDSVYANYRTANKDIDLKDLRLKTDSSLKAIQENIYFNLKNHIEKHPSELSSIIGLYSRFANKLIFDMELDSSMFYLVSDSCYRKYPNNSHAIALIKAVAESKSKIHNIEIKEKLLDKENIFKDICLLKSDETNYCIYNNTAKHKIIYIWRSKDKAFWDFNPILKQIYKSTSRQDLDIIGISAEKDKLSWRNYCNMEELNWINLIAEPDKIDVINPRGTFPRIYLLDENFRIIAKDPNVKDIMNLIHK